MSSKIAIVLSGCGVNDGAEIHESVITLMSVLRIGATPLFFAPDIQQKQVVNHFTKQKTDETRNVLVESARIARSDIKPLSELNASGADAVIFPGGFGAALNLCDFALQGPNCNVEKESERVILDFHKNRKPIGAICIAPALVARVLGKNRVEVTIGNDAGTATAIEKCGAVHVNCTSDQIHVDEMNRVVTTPGYMLANDILEVEEGITALTNQIHNMTL